MLVASDHITFRDYPAVNRVRGDLFVSSLMSAILQISDFFSDNLCRFPIRIQYVAVDSMMFLGGSDG